MYQVYLICNFIKDSPRRGEHPYANIKSPITLHSRVITPPLVSGPFGDKRGGYDSEIECSDIPEGFYIPKLSYMVAPHTESIAFPFPTSKVSVTLARGVLYVLWLAWRTPRVAERFKRL